MEAEMAANNTPVYETIGTLLVVISHSIFSGQRPTITRNPPEELTETRAVDVALAEMKNRNNEYC